MGVCKLPGLGGKIGRDRIPCRLGHKNNGNGRRRGRSLENGIHISLGVQLRRTVRRAVPGDAATAQAFRSSTMAHHAKPDRMTAATTRSRGTMVACPLRDEGCDGFFVECN